MVHLKLKQIYPDIIPKTGRDCESNNLHYYSYEMRQ